MASETAGNRQDYTPIAKTSVPATATAVLNTSTTKGGSSDAGVNTGKLTPMLLTSADTMERPFGKGPVTTTGTSTGTKTPTTTTPTTTTPSTTTPTTQSSGGLVNTITNFVQSLFETVKSGGGSKNSAVGINTEEIRETLNKDVQTPFGSVALWMLIAGGLVIYSLMKKR